MRHLLLVGVVLCVCPVLAADDKPAPLSPAQAAKSVDKKVTLEMEVKSVGKGKDIYFLNSEADFKSDKNFTIFLNADAVKKLKEAKVDDPAAQYKGKTVRVTGTVKLYREKPEIVVEDPKSIEIVDPKK